MRLDVLTNEELFKLAAHQDEFNDHINKEWKIRFQLSFPYQLSECNNKIYNSLLAIELDFEECDKKIVEQANILRENVAKKECTV